MEIEHAFGTATSDEQPPEPEQLEEDQPTWRNQPAVEPEQVGGWNGETVFSPRGFADSIESLTEVLAAADAAVVS